MARVEEYLPIFGISDITIHGKHIFLTEKLDKYDARRISACYNPL